MLIDCDSCAKRNLECQDCVVSFMLADSHREVDSAEVQALSHLAGSGLVPPLRFIPSPESPGSATDSSAQSA